MTQNKVSWTVLKTTALAKGRSLQYIEETDAYLVYLVDSGFSIYSRILKTSPANADQTDFVDNFQSSANALLDTSKLVGATDGTEIGNTGDRLKVEATVSVSPVPQTDVMHIPEYLQTGASSPEMTVDGDSTAVQFSWAAPSEETWYLTGINLLLIDPGTMDATDFGSISSELDNGLLIEIRSKGVTYTFCNLKNNMDLSVLFGGGGAGGQTGALFDSAGFLDDNDIFRGSKEFTVPIKLQNSTGDFIRVTVRDDLTNIRYLRATINKFRLL